MKRMGIGLFVWVLLGLMTACTVSSHTVDEPLYTIDEPLFVHPLMATTTPGSAFLRQDATFTSYETFRIFVDAYHAKFQNPSDAIDAWAEPYDETFFTRYTLRVTQLPEQNGITLEVRSAYLSDDTIELTLAHQLPVRYPIDNIQHHFVAVAYAKDTFVNQVRVNHDIMGQNHALATYYLFPAAYTEIGDFWTLQPLETLADLQEYVAGIQQNFANRENCQTWGLWSCYLDGHHGFHDVIARYDDAFFVDHIVLFLPMMEGSGSIRHTLDDLVYTEDQLTLHLSRHVPEIGTSDMKNWLLIVEIPRPQTPVEFVLETLCKCKE